MLESVVVDMGWSSELEQARIIEEWPAFVGTATAEHTTVTGIRDGVLEIQCDSTTWATELRRLRAEMLTRLLTEYPDSEIRDLRFRAPGAPSWRHGPRVVPGRGPRDTYG
ncbi:DciA family protein [Leucobacter aridicollis]|uniref:Putative nucleic acid-binding Zn ribbon protein n=2 Tax=Leucobacter aridicollis TaxID=283878 RepID=A0A852RGA6_9MICO|nr:DciA family protein [Leucobacter aridicollis]MCS3428925.1 putative nucleic acid-binding Zn ribbon protein [Leucobacter aridicollis]NYD28386.1 putative nucleic acid-binding Zn ribbon protein [Leucobacter aridicollis]